MASPGWQQSTFRPSSSSANEGFESASPGATNMQQQQKQPLPSVPQGYAPPLRWQPPQPGSTPAARIPGLPPGTPLAYPAFQAAPSNQWLIQQRPQFLYPAPGFGMQFQRPEGMHPTFRPIGDHPYHALGNLGWGGNHGNQVEQPGGTTRTELPDFHPYRTSAAVTLEAMKSTVSDTKSEKTLKLEVSEEDAWTAHKTEDGEIYYYNSVTGESTYEKPANFKVEAANVTSQPVPSSWEKVDGTDWLLVKTNDGKNYYHNEKTKETSWQVPAELVEITKKRAEEAPIDTPAASSGGRESQPATPNAASVLETIKKKLQDSTTLNLSILEPEIVKADEPGTEKSKENAEGSTTDSSSSSDHEGPTPTLTKEEKIAQFKEMLKEKAIAPFSKWDKELPKILYDPRFKAIPSYAERRSLFEHYVRTRADEERKEKRAKQKALVEAFKQLLEEAVKDVTQSTTYDSFAQTWGHDPRFEALEPKDRENLLNERVLSLKKAEAKRVKAIQEAAAAAFRAMLKEANVSSGSRWSKLKETLRDDPRYQAVKREEREDMFDAYVGELRAEADRIAKAKREEENKQRELRKRKEREGQELERVRSKARRKDAVSSYQALLTEKIKDPEASWTESRPKLERDPLGRASNPELDNSDKERLFRDHVNDLYERCGKDFRSLLMEAVTPEGAARHLEDGKHVLTSWSDAKELLGSDHRFVRMPRRARESLWRRHVEDIQRRSKDVK